MSAWDAMLLGLVQGLTEFLPISSSGHLVLGKTLLGIVEPDIAFEVFVHFGSLLAVVLAFRRDIAALLRALVEVVRMPFDRSRRDGFSDPDSLKLVGYLALATLPAVAVGLALEERIEAAFSDPVRVCWMLLLTAVILLATAFVRPGDRPLNLRNTFLMGLAQSLAILPGISRSGSTISVGLYQKISGARAARFSFLLALPAIAGATLLKSIDMLSAAPDSARLGILAIGTGVSFLSSYFAIAALLKIVRRGKLYYFAPYCLAVGIIGLILLSK